MQNICPECGAKVLAGETCQTNFHALLYREAEVGQLSPDYFATTIGQTAHDDIKAAEHLSHQSTAKKIEINPPSSGEIR